ncbi:hypothetical protein ACFY1U_18975 [Streptomyces sp. NPDC001351]|uniref:hypothetical protein n=1 Tax=Streptomyces sp. NPDC001351 TaxID=3364564 RepID=UPI0036A0B57F
METALVRGAGPPATAHAEQARSFAGRAGRIAEAAVLVSGPNAQAPYGRWAEAAGTADLRTGRAMNTADPLRIVGALGGLADLDGARVRIGRAAAPRLSSSAPCRHGRVAPPCALCHLRERSQDLLRLDEPLVDLDALLTALLDRQQARAFGRLLEAVPGTQELHDPAAFVAEAVRRMSAMLREDPDTWRLILLTPGNMPTVVRDRIEADRERFRLQVAGWISTVLADRSGPALDPQVLAHALVACAEHFGRIALTDPGRFDPPPSSTRCR